MLSVEPGAVRLERLNLGAPFLDTHNSSSCANVVGSIVPGSPTLKDGVGSARVLLSKAAGVADTVQKIVEGVLRNTSVGYWIHKIIKTEADDKTVARWDVVDWEPLEVSCVPIPADPGSQIRSEGARAGQDGQAKRSCVLVTPEPPAAGPKPKAKQETRMATRKTPAKKTPAEELAALRAENVRLTGLVAAKRDDDTKKDKDKEDDEDEDERDAMDADGENAGDEGEERAEDEDGEERDADADDDEDDDEDKKKKDDRSAATPARRTLTVAEVRKAAQEAVRKDRVRGADIRKVAAQFGYPKLGEKHANGETSVREFKDLVLERLAARQAKAGSTTFAASGAREHDEEPTGRVAPTSQRRIQESAADEMRALLGIKKAA